MYAYQQQRGQHEHAAAAAAVATTTAHHHSPAASIETINPGVIGDVALSTNVNTHTIIQSCPTLFPTSTEAWHSLLNSPDHLSVSPPPPFSNRHPRLALWDECQYYHQHHQHHHHQVRGRTLLGHCNKRIASTNNGPSYPVLVIVRPRSTGTG